MFDPQKGIVGILLGTEKIFLTQLKRTAGKFEIEKSITVALPEKMIIYGAINDIDGLAQILKKVFIDNNIKARQVYAAILENNAIMRTVQCPNMSKPKTREALKSEVDKYMLSAEEAVIDYYSLDDGKVFFVAIKKSILDALLGAMEKAKLNLIGIDIAPLAIWRALQGDFLKSKDNNENQAVMLILVRAQSIDIIIISKGAPVYSRNIDISETSEIDKEIQMTKAYWEEQFPNNSMSKTIIKGDSTEANNLVEQLSKSLDVAENVNPLNIANCSLSQSASIGLAMRAQGEKFTFDMNLLPLEKFKKNELEKKTLLGFKIFAGIMAGLFIINIGFSLIINGYGKKLNLIQQDLLQSSGLIYDVEKISRKRSNILNILNQEKAFIAKMESAYWPGIFIDIRDFIPHGVELTKIFSDEDMLTLKGKSFSQDAVYKYVNLLAFSDYFNNPKLAVIQTEQDEDQIIVKFDIICPLSKEKKK